MKPINLELVPIVSVRASATSVNIIIISVIRVVLVIIVIVVFFKVGIKVVVGIIFVFDAIFFSL